MGSYKARRRNASRLGALQTRFAGNAALAVDPHAMEADVQDFDDVIDEEVEFETPDEFSVPDEFDPAAYDDEVVDEEAEALVQAAAIADPDDVELATPIETPDDEDALTALDVDAAETAAIAAPEDEPIDDLAALDVADVEDEEPPFDPPDDEDDDAPVGMTAEAAAPVAAEPAPAPKPQPALVLVQEAPTSPRPAAVAELRTPPAAAAPAKPAPPIAIHLSWERPEAAPLAAALSADRRLLQAVVTQSGGGLERIALEAAPGDEPDLVIVDTTLTARPMLAAFERAKSALKPGAKIVVLGRVNDVGLLRELLRRGASHYLLHPVDPDQLVRLICELYEDADNARVIAVVGARGGVGASTVAHNLAWCIGAKRQAATTLADFDLSFGAAAFGFDPNARRENSPLLTGDLDEEKLNQYAVRPHPRLRVLPAPASLAADGALDPDAVQALVEHLRRTSAFAVLDLPHAWTSGVRHALSLADEIVVVAAPDLASMRNTKSMLEWLKRSRPGGREPLVVLSMVGAPKRPEIGPKEFSEAIGAHPVCSLAFDAATFGLAELKGLPLDELAPASRQAALLDALAEDLSGLKPKPVAARPAAPAPPAAAPDLELRLDMRVEPSPPQAPPQPQAPKASAAPSPRAPATPRRPRRLRQLASAPPRRRGRPGTLRTAAAVVALGLVGGWFLGQSGFHPEFIRNYLNAIAVDLAG